MAQHGPGLVALRAPRHDLFQPRTHRGGALQLVLLVGLLPPRLAQLGQHLVQGAGRGIAGGLPRGPGGGIRGTEISPVPAERADPLFAGVIEVGCHNVGGIALAAAGHPDVGGCCGGVVADHEVRGGRGAALRAVRGAGVAKLDVFTHVFGGQLAPAAVTANG